MDLLGAIQKSIRRLLVARGAESSMVSLRGCAVHYYQLRSSGPGPPVLLVHGLGGSANGFFKVLFPLSHRFSRVLALDLPGSGFSPLPSGGPLSLEQLFEVVAAFCEEVVGRPAFVIGNSLGGAMCLALASERPSHVQALALLAPAGARLEEGQRVELLKAMKVTNSDEARALTRRLFHRAPLTSLLFASELRKMYGTEAVRAVLSEIDGTSFLPPEALARISAPTLLLWGGSEKLLPPEALEYFRVHLPPPARVRVVRGFGHVPQMERPAELVSALIRFADEVQL